MKTRDDVEDLATVPSHIGEVHDDPTQAHDAVFGEITDKGPNYRNVCILKCTQTLID